MKFRYGCHICSLNAMSFGFGHNVNTLYREAYEYIDEFRLPKGVSTLVVSLGIPISRKRIPNGVKF